MMTRLYLRVSEVQELCFWIEHARQFDERGKTILRELVQIIPGGRLTTRPTMTGSVVQIGPRLSMLTPWSSSATEILEGCGLEAERFEMLTRYAIPKGVNKQQFAASIYDQMTQQIYDRNILTFSKEVEIPKVQIVPVLKEGRDALRQVSTRLGLGFDSQDVDAYYHLFAEVLKRNPTDAEMFDLGQTNSDHCRHKVFNGEWTIDGVLQKQTLFDLIRRPYFSNPGNCLVAFHDNSSVIKGFPVKMAVPRYPWKSSDYVIITVHADGTLTVETHNHPTAISPYPGAGTGTGGRQRDNVAIGTGGRLGVAWAGFFTANLNLPDYRLPWELRNQKYPPNLACAADIIRLASDGACEYSNPSGEPVIAGCSRAVEMYMPDGSRRAWFKPIMATGGMGIVRHEHISKAEARKGMLIVQIGGPAFDIGFGGGSASSQVSGDNKAKLDWKSVQRADAEMAIRNHRVISACIALGRKNPIRLLHDQGAGGVCNVLKELIEAIGGVIYSGKIHLGDKYLPFIVRWGAEYQERYGLLIEPKSLRLFRRVCKRERCPLEILGRTTGDGKIVVHNNIKGDNRQPINLVLKQILAGMPRKKYVDKHVPMYLPAFALPRNTTIADAANRVLRNLAVASKEHYTDKGDRSVGGLVILQQDCGPANAPVADCGIMALGHFSPEGQVFSIGEQPLKLMIDPEAGARMAANEGLMNMAGAVITSIGDIKSSVNWMWPALHPGEGAAMFDTCRALSNFLRKAGAPVRGKDSSSMKVTFEGENVPAPRQVIITFHAMMRDVRKFVTPDLKQSSEDNELWFIDLGFGKDRMGGSILAQCYNKLGDNCPDIEPELTTRAFKAIQELVFRGLILSYHDRSDGGLFTTFSEMAFAGNCGAFIYLNSVNSPIQALFSEEAGAVIEVDPINADKATAVLKRFGIKAEFIGRPLREDKIHVEVNGRPVFMSTMTSLRQTWRETSYQLKRLQKNPDSALQEKKNLRVRQGISYKFPMNWDGKAQFKVQRTQHQPVVAILREIGTNSDQEMVASFEMAGFRTADVAMSDLESGVVRNLNRFAALAACGGFSNGDVLGSARGWALKILYNAKLRRIFWEFVTREDALSYWVCNGAQLAGQLGWFPYLPEDGRPVKDHWVFTYNTSRKFEARWSLVGVRESPSIMLRGLEGCRLGVHVAHGEGHWHCSNRQLWNRIITDRLAPVRFVGDDGVTTERYPYNPNESPLGITGLTTPCGRHTIVMPHFERSVQMRQWQYIPEHLKALENSPWLRAFENMRNYYR